MLWCLLEFDLLCMFLSLTLLLMLLVFSYAALMLLSRYCYRGFNRDNGWRWLCNWSACMFTVSDEIYDSDVIDEVVSVKV